MPATRAASEAPPASRPPPRPLGAPQDRPAPRFAPSPQAAQQARPPPLQPRHQQPRRRMPWRRRPLRRSRPGTNPCTTTSSFSLDRPPRSCPSPPDAPRLSEGSPPPQPLGGGIGSDLSRRVRESEANGSKESRGAAPPRRRRAEILGGSRRGALPPYASREARLRRAGAALRSSGGLVGGPCPPTPHP